MWKGCLKCRSSAERTSKRSPLSFLYASSHVSDWGARVRRTGRAEQSSVCGTTSPDKSSDSRTNCATSSSNSNASSAASSASTRTRSDTRASSTKSRGVSRATSTRARHASESTYTLDTPSSSEAEGEAEGEAVSGLRRRNSLSTKATAGDEGAWRTSSSKEKT